MKKAVLFIGLGDWNCKFIDEAKKFGFGVLATNKNPKSLSLKKADESLVTDGNNIASILNFVFPQSQKYEIVSVYCGTELFITKEVVSFALGLVHNPLKAALAGENKAFAREFFTKAKIPIPDGDVLDNLEDAKKLSRKLKYPIIIKPANQLASLGIAVVKNERSLKKAFLDAKKYSDQIIIERFLEGTLHDVNGFFHKGKFYECGISDKSVSRPPYLYVDTLSCPSVLSSEQKKELYNLLLKSAKAIGVEHGPVKADVILTKEGFKLMEIALRLHGPLVSVYCLPNGEGINPFEYYLSVLSGERYETIKNDKKYIFIKSINSKTGTIQKIQGLADAKKIKGVLEILISKKAGQRVEVPKSNFDLCGYVVIADKDKEATQKTYSKFLKVFKITTR